MLLNRDTYQLNLLSAIRQWGAPALHSSSHSTHYFLPINSSFQDASQLIFGDGFKTFFCITHLDIERAAGRLGMTKEWLLHVCGREPLNILNETVLKERKDILFSDLFLEEKYQRIAEFKKWLEEDRSKGNIILRPRSFRFPPKEVYQFYKQAIEKEFGLTLPFCSNCPESSWLRALQLCIDPHDRLRLTEKPDPEFAVVIDDVPSLDNLIPQQGISNITQFGPVQTIPDEVSLKNTSDFFQKFFFIGSGNSGKEHLSSTNSGSGKNGVSNRKIFKRKNTKPDSQKANSPANNQKKKMRLSDTLRKSKRLNQKSGITCQDQRGQKLK